MTFDVVVVGARCAGSPLAALLARRGVRVAVVEQATFPRDTLSSHIFESDALAFLDRLGVADRLRATGAPFVRRIDLRAEDLRVQAPWPQRSGDVGGMASVRRMVLDPILAGAAAEAGAEVLMGSRVTGLVEEEGRVAGVRLAGETGETALRARLVVGADGRSSTVARLSGARAYNAAPNERALYWAFFEDADADMETFVSHRWADRFILGIPSDGGLYQVLVWPEFADRDRFPGDLDGLFMDQATSCEPIARAIAGAARRVGKIHGAIRWTGYFREASGPGWVLAGDAGHFKDPAPGRGIADAFLQADALAPAIAAGLQGGASDLDAAMTQWGRWRDGEFSEHYWLATDLGKTGAVPAVLPELVRGLHRRGRLDLFLDLLNHRVKPSAVLTPPRLLGATGRAVARQRGARPAVLREVGGLLAQDVRRRKLNRRPDYGDGAGAGAGAPGLEEATA